MDFAREHRVFRAIFFLNCPDCLDCYYKLALKCAWSVSVRCWQTCLKQELTTIYLFAIFCVTLSIWILVRLVAWCSQGISLWNILHCWTLQCHCRMPVTATSWMLLLGQAQLLVYSTVYALPFIELGKIPVYYRGPWPSTTSTCNLMWLI